MHITLDHEGIIDHEGCTSFANCRETFAEIFWETPEDRLSRIVKVCRVDEDITRGGDDVGRDRRGRKNIPCETGKWKKGPPQCQRSMCCRCVVR